VTFTVLPCGSRVPGAGFCFFTFLPWPLTLGVQLLARIFFFAFFFDFPFTFGTVQVGPAGRTMKSWKPFWPSEVV